MLRLFIIFTFIAVQRVQFVSNRAQFVRIPHARPRQEPRIAPFHSPMLNCEIVRPFSYPPQRWGLRRQRASIHFRRFCETGPAPAAGEP